MCPSSQSLPVSRTIISKWTRKGRPGLSWLPTTSRLCLSTDRGFQGHPDISVPPPHAPPATPLSYHLSSPPSHPAMFLRSLSWACCQPCCVAAAAPGLLWLRRAGVAWSWLQERCYQRPTASPASAESSPHHGCLSASCEERALPRAVIGCSTAFWNLPEQASQSGRDLA